MKSVLFIKLIVFLAILSIELIDVTYSDETLKNASNHCRALRAANTISHKKKYLFEVPDYYQHVNRMFPWIGSVFPDCWYGFTLLFNDSSLSYSIDESKCKKLCWNVYSACSMLSEFESVRSCIDMKELSGYCEDLAKTQCDRVELPQYKKGFLKTCDSILIPSEVKSHWVIQWMEMEMKNITNQLKGCSLPCGSRLSLYQQALYTIDTHIKLFGTVGMSASLFTIISFLIDWKYQRRYPAIILFILNACIFCCYFGWILQFFGAGKLISCSENQEKRYEEPKSADSVWCVLSFILIYTSSLAIACWFVVLNYAWYLSFHTVKEIRIVIENKVKFFHLLSWGIAVLLTSMVLLFGEVEAHPITGICFVSIKRRSIRDTFITSPFIISFLIGETLLIANIFELRKLKERCGKLDVQKAVSNISRTIYRMVFYGFTMFVAVTTAFFCMFQESLLVQQSDRKYYSFIRCSIERMTSSPLPECKPPNKANLFFLHLQFISFFVISMVTSSWTWTRATLRIWVKVWKRLRFGVNEQERLQRSWYLRNHRKKIRPFVPPINPNNPFEEVPLKFRNFPPSVSKRHSLPELCNSKHRHHTNNGSRRRSSDDIRSVVELFSNRRRNTLTSLDMLNPSPTNDSRMIRKNTPSSLQSYGHLKTAHNFDESVMHRPSSNLTLVCASDNHCEDETQHKLTTASAMKELLEIRNILYTPLSTAHKDNIVADCIPYNRILTSSLASLDFEDDLVWLQTEHGRKSIALEALSLSSTEII